MSNTPKDHFDPAAWFMEWPHEEQSVWQVHRDVHARFGLAAQRSAELETALAMLVRDLTLLFKGADQLYALIYKPLLEQRGICEESLKKHAQELIERSKYDNAA